MLHLSCCTFVLLLKIKTLHSQNISWELLFRSLHNSHAIHCASRNYSWKAHLLCVTVGPATAQKDYGESIFGVITTLVKIITRMKFCIFKRFRALQLQLSGVFRINQHYSYSFLFFGKMQLHEVIPNVMISKRMVHKIDLMRPRPLV